MPTTPTTEEVWPQQQVPTPQKSRIQGTIDYPHWDDTTTVELIKEGWELVSQESINKRILSMPDRLRAVIAKMTGF